MYVREPGSGSVRNAFGRLSGKCSQTRAGGRVQPDDVLMRFGLEFERRKGAWGKGVVESAAWG